MKGCVSVVAVESVPVRVSYCRCGPVAKYPDPPHHYRDPYAKTKDGMKILLEINRVIHLRISQPTSNVLIHAVRSHTATSCVSLTEYRFRILTHGISGSAVDSSWTVTTSPHSQMIL